MQNDASPRKKTSPRKFARVWSKNVEKNRFEIESRCRKEGESWTPARGGGAWDLVIHSGARSIKREFSFHNLDVL